MSGDNNFVADLLNVIWNIKILPGFLIIIANIMKFILGKKLEMTQIFQEDGKVVPVTTVLAEPNVVVQIKTNEKEKYNAVQVGFGGGKNINKSQLGHLKGLRPAKIVREFRVDADDVASIKRGDSITVEAFAKNDEVKVTGVSKGKGFQGVVRRHGFHGSPATHGHKDQLRMPGSIGATDPARVFKGMRMAGHMGDDQITVSGLEIIDIDIAKNLLYIKGAVPGARNGLLLISAPGKMDLTVKEVEAEVVPEVIEETPIETTATESVVEETPVPVVEAVIEEVKTEENK